MFLINTADERFWRLDGPVLLLGDWCRTFQNRDKWTRVSHEVLPYHWEDREKLHRDYAMLDALYERTLATLTEQLNALHTTRHSLRYWRILIGPWLSMFTSILFDRYECVMAAGRSGKVHSTWVGDYTPTEWLPKEIGPFLRWVGDSDAYNQYLFSMVISETGAVPFEVIRPAVRSAVTSASVTRPHRRPLRAALAWAGTQAVSFVPSRFKRIVLFNSSLHAWDQARLELLLGQIPTWNPPAVLLPKARFESALRARLELPARSGFERVLAKLVQLQMPSAYLEHYTILRVNALRKYPKRPEVIFTANSYEAYEGFKTWAAEHAEHGITLVGTQHGCHYGTARCMDTEDHQLRIYDRFYSWGWESPAAPHVTPLAAAKFNVARARVRPHPGGSVLVASFVWPRYAYRLYSVPIAAPGVVRYLEEQFRFAIALPPHVRRSLVVRPFPNDRGWHQQERWAERLPDVECYRGPKKFLEQLNDCRLFVTTCTSTPHLEAFAADFPTVLFWDPSQFELRPSAQPFYDALVEVGVLYTTPEAAAAKVTEIFEDPLSWWAKPPVQQARLAFCKQFARTSTAWLSEWRSELLRLARSPVGPGADAAEDRPVPAP